MQLTTYRNLPYPANLWSVVFQREYSKEDIPKDWEAVLNSLLPTLRDVRREQMIRYYFRQHLTLNQIGEIYGMTREAVRQHINGSISLLRKPAKKEIMKMGLQAECVDRKQKVNRENHKSQTARKILDMSVAELDARTEVTNALCRNGVSTVRELIEQTETSLLTFRNMGVASIGEIKKVLAYYGFQLASDKKEEPTDKRPLLDEKEISLNVLAMYISDLKMSNRATNALQRNNILTVKELIAMTENELCELRGLGKLTINEIKARLEQFRTTVLE